MSWVFPREKLCPRDKTALARYDEGQYVPYYRTKYGIARTAAKAKGEGLRILEIGVRAGYSAYAFLCACPKARYVGYDAENGQHGGAGGPWMPWAREILGGFSHVELVEIDTQKMESFLYEYDFIHVDGDHSTKGCRHDMDLSWEVLSPGGLMLVDDYTYIRTVRSAVDGFLAENASGCRVEHRESIRGEVLIWKPRG